MEKVSVGTKCWNKTKVLEKLSDLTILHNFLHFPHIIKTVFMAFFPKILPLQPNLEPTGSQKHMLGLKRGLGVWYAVLFWVNKKLYLYY
jgi:hypothetical protein